MQAYMTQISNYLLRQSWQIAILVIAVAVVSWILRNKSAHVRYLLWLIVIAKCLVPPVTTIPLAILPQGSVFETASMLMIDELFVTTGVMDNFDHESPQRRLKSTQGPPRAIATEKTTMLTIRQRLGAGWIVGMIFFVLIAMVKAVRTELWLRRQRKVLPAGLQDQIEILFSDLKLKTFPCVWLVEGVNQPFVWGLLRGGIYLPSDFVKVNSAEQRRGILGHELSHIFRFDAAINILQLIAQAIFWFHPFVWWANRKIRAEREKCCDEITIAGLGAKARDYSKAIVNILISEQKQAQAVPCIAVAGPVKNIEERIKTMLKPGKKFYKRPSLRAIAVLLMVALLTIPFGWGLTRSVRAETASDPQDKPSKSLHEAAQDGDNNQIRLLLAQGADVNAKYGNGATPLHTAIMNGKLDTANLLIQKGADVNAMARNANTLLHVVALKGDIKTANLLISKGADVNAENRYGLTPVSRALLSDGGGRLMVELLVSKGAKVSELHLAAHRGDIDKVRSSLTKGTKVDVCDKAGHTPLFYAASAGQMHVVEFLISKGADVNAKDNRAGETPLFYAGDAGWKNVVELLIAEGADINARGAGRSSALTSAIWLGRVDVAELLIAKGADVNARDDWGYIPLHPAARHGLAEIVEMLISKGGDVNARTGWGETPLHSATLDQTQPGVMPLYSATRDGKIRVVQILIANGADVNPEDEKFGQTPFQSAQKNGFTEIVELLRKHGAKEAN